MPTITLPAGKPGQPYYECYTLTGKPKRLAMDSFPVGVTATLKGNQLCVKAEKFPATGFDWGVQVLSCRLCDPLELNGTIAASAEDCPCTVVGDIVSPAPITVPLGDEISLVIPLTGTGPFEFCDQYKAPRCISMEIFGDKVLISGKVEQSGVIAFSVKNACTCDCKEVIIFVNADRPPCVVSWSLSETSFTAGQEKTQTYTATGIPDGCSLVLEAFVGNAPLIIGGSQATTTLTSAQPTRSFPQLWPASSVGQDYNWRPAVNQPSCMTCTIQPQRIDFDVAAVPACTTSWSISETSFVSGVSKDQTYTASNIPAGCSLKLLAWKADNTPFILGGAQASVTLSASNPTATFPQLYPADNSLAGSYYWAPDATQLACMTCTVQPSRIDFDVAPASVVLCPSLKPGFSGAAPVQCRAQGATDPGLIENVVAGGTWSKSHDWDNVDSQPTVTITPNTSGASITNPSTTSVRVNNISVPGTYVVDFVGSKTGCPPCVVRYTVTVAAGAPPPPPPQTTPCFTVQPCNSGFRIVSVPASYASNGVATVSLEYTLNGGATWFDNPDFAVDADGKIGNFVMQCSGDYWTANGEFYNDIDPQMARLRLRYLPTGQVIPSCNGANSIPPPPPPPPPPAPNCPQFGNGFSGAAPVTCGSSVTVNIAAGGAWSQSHSWTDSTSATVSGLGGTNGVAGGNGVTQVAVTSLSTPGTHFITFTGSKAGCASCSVTYQVIIAAGTSALCITASPCDNGVVNLSIPASAGLSSLVVQKSIGTGASWTNQLTAPVLSTGVIQQQLACQVLDPYYWDGAGEIYQLSAPNTKYRFVHPTTGAPIPFCGGANLPAACATNWSISTTAFQNGVTATQTYTATGIPPGCQLVLQAYENGAPMNIGGVFPTVTLTNAAPSVSFPQTWPASYVGAQLDWRPAPTQSPCLTCAINPQFISFAVI